MGSSSRQPMMQGSTSPAATQRLYWILAKKSLKKLFEESKPTYYIDIYDETGEYHRQWPNNAWPPPQNWLIFKEGVAKKKKAFTVAELKQMGVTHATQLRDIGCTYTSS